MEAARIAERLLAGDRGALARSITWAENADPRFPDLLAGIFPRVGHAWRSGITGPPGAGKSTLVNELTRLLRERGRSVGILAVDPSSPFSGGALLGDRIRMQELTLDPGVFIRSMASRGSHGGLARATVDACDVMDAFGFDEVLIETVGVGQAEFDVASAADHCVVVLCPGAGDAIQAMKAGLLELADVLVVNKADLPGAERLVLDLEEAVHIRSAGKPEWEPPVVRCSAGKAEHVERVLHALDAHREFLAEDRRAARRREKRVRQVERVISERLNELIWSGSRGRRVEALLDSQPSPYHVASKVLAEFMERLSDEGAREENE